jgi:hypothetical protein
MSSDRHQITVPAPDISRADLEDARRGLPSRSVSPADIQAVYTPQPAGECRTFHPGDPGYRLLVAETDSPEYQAELDAYYEEARQEALAEAGFMQRAGTGTYADWIGPGREPEAGYDEPEAGS